jgi:hypothetical protein
LKCWDKVYDTTFFSDRLEKAAKAESAVASPAVLTSGLLGAIADRAPAAVRKEGGGRYA